MRGGKIAKFRLTRFARPVLLVLLDEGKPVEGKPVSLN